MRVTETMIYQQSIERANAALVKVGKAQSQLSSGLRVQAPGDDPQAAGLLVRHKFDQTQIAAIQNGAQSAANELNTADSALGSVSTALARAQVLATQLGNDTYSANDRAAAATEIDGLFKQVVGSLNTRLGDRYIFGGYVDNQPPFTAAGAYQGDAGMRQVEVAPGVYEDASVRADVTAKGVGGGVDILQTLTDLSSALRANDGAAIRGSIASLQTGSDQISTAQSQAGTSVNIFTSAVSTCTQQNTDETKIISQLGDADVMDASTQLSLAQYALNATLTAASQTLNLSLVSLLSK
jgi:flagellar hook-associated protein 3 FlgL